jgi:hypothetical protein
MKIRTALTLAVLATSLFSPAHAQQAADSGWHYLIQPYALLPNMKGETGIADLPAVSVDQDPQDIFDHLDLGAMLYAEAHNDRWAFSSDVLYMDLGQRATPKGIVTDGDVDISQVGWELAALRRLTPWFELGLAATYNNIKADVKVTTDTILGVTTRSAGLTEEWIDPTVVARATFPLRGNWFFQGRGNIGGFGIGSDLVWQVQADVGYRHSDKWLFTFGYRIIDIDYDHGSGADRFVYDMQTFGPVLKVGYSF